MPKHYLAAKRKYALPELSMLAALLKKRLDILKKLERKRLPKQYSLKAISKALSINISQVHLAWTRATQNPDIEFDEDACKNVRMRAGRPKNVDVVPLD